jgi:hypothetical protein
VPTNVHEVQRMRIGANRGSHLPVLTTMIQMTTGPILEMGMGYCSTPYLHWVCYPSKRRLVSYESAKRYFSYAESWKADYHEVHCIDDWDTADISEPWTVAFVDHHPGNRRVEEIKRLLHAEYVVIHDTENKGERGYHLSTVKGLFKYRWKYTAAFPYTSIWSNKHDVSGFKI